MAESALAQIEKLGWTVQQERDPLVREAAGGKNAVTTVLVDEGHYEATKRHPNGNTLVQFADTTPERLLVLVEGWEHAQVSGIEAPAPDPKEKAYEKSAKNSAAATASLASPTGGNKPGPE